MHSFVFGSQFQKLKNIKIFNAISVCTNIELNDNFISYMEQFNLYPVQQFQTPSGASAVGNEANAGSSASFASSASMVLMQTTRSDNTGGGTNITSSTGVGVDGSRADMHTGEPPATLQMLDELTTSSGGNASQHEKLENRLGLILCCTVCKDLPNTAMYQCRLGHLICAACFARLSNGKATCSICRIEITNSTAVRNFAVENVVSELPSQCYYCKEEFPYKFIDRHRKEDCQERFIRCKYSRIGCQWYSPIHETIEHERNCLQPSKSGYEVIAALEAQDADLEAINKEDKIFSTLTDLLSHEKIVFDDLQLRPYSTYTYEYKRNLIYETPRFTAFNQQWVVKARINNDQRTSINPPQPNKSTIFYQLILKTKSIAPMNIHFFVLKGPFSDVKVSTQIHQHEFSKQSTESDYFVLPLPDSAECNRLLSNKVINFRFMMFLEKNK